MIRNEKSNRTVIKWLSKVAGLKRLYIILLLVIQMLLGMIGVGYAIILRGLIDAAVAGAKVTFFKWIAFFVVAIIVQIILGTWNRFLGEYASASMENRFKERLLQFLFNRDYASITAIHSGEWMNRLTSDTVVVANSLIQILPGVAGMLIRLLGAIAMFLVLYPKGACVFVSGGILLLVVTYVFRKKLKRLHKQVQEADGSLRVFLQECLSSMLVVRTFAQENQVIQEAKEKMNQHKAVRMKKNHFSNLSNVGFASVMNGAYVLVVGICGYGILNGTMSYGTLMAMIQLLGQIQSPFANITNYVPQYYAMLASAERLMEIEQYEADMLEAEKSLPEVQRFYQTQFQSIQFKQVHFAYKTMDDKNSERTMVLQDINLEIPKGSCVAFTGPSGCGKSTILKLMMALYPIDGGERILKTTDAMIPLTAMWRRMFAYVPQGNQLMSGTIREIITFRNEQQMKEEERIEQALKIADAEDFVNQLPDGIDTVLGEQGTGLSEGQMQRIAIARAVFADNPIMMLDESTSALDEQTEKNVLANLRSMTDKTIVIVTHRKAVLEICDLEIQFLEDGSVGRNILLS